MTADPSAPRDDAVLLTLAATIDPEAFACPMPSRKKRDRSIAMHCAAKYLDAICARGYVVTRADTGAREAVLRADLTATTPRPSARVQVTEEMIDRALVAGRGNNGSLRDAVRAALEAALALAAPPA